MKNRHPETLNAIRPVLIRKVGETFGSTINAARSMHSDNCSGNEGSIITSKQNFCHELIGQANNRVALKCNNYGDSIDTETEAAHFTRSALLKQREVIYLVFIFFIIVNNLFNNFIFTLGTIERK